MSPQELFKQYQPVAKRIALAYLRKVPRSVLRDDLEAAALLGLWQAVNGNPDREGFEWYLRVRVRGAVLDELRRQDWLPRRMRQRALEEGAAAVAVIRMDDLSPQEREGLGFALPPADELADEHRTRADLDKEIARLPDREREILERLMSGATQDMIAAEQGVSAPRVSQLRARAIARLRGEATSRYRRPKRGPQIPVSVISNDPSALRVLWCRLCGGSWRVSQIIATPETFGVEIVRVSGQRLSNRTRYALEHWLRNGQYGRLIAKLKLPRSSVMAVLKSGLTEIGITQTPSKVPLVIALAAQAPRRKEHGQVIWDWASPCRIEFARADVDQGSSPAEREVARDLLDGLSGAEIATRRGTSPTAVARQVARVFRRAGVSGVSALRTQVARSFFDRARLPAPESAPTVPDCPPPRPPP